LVLAERSNSLFQPGSITLKGKLSDIGCRTGSMSEYNQHLRPLVRIYDVIDEEIMDCLNNHCRGRCRFDLVRAVTSQRALDVVDPSETSGRVQLADFRVSKLWLKSRLWQACLAHMLLQPTPSYPEVGLDYPLIILAQLNDVVNSLPLSAFGGNGQAIGVKIQVIVASAETVLSVRSPSDISLPHNIDSVEALRNLVGHLHSVARTLSTKRWLRYERSCDLESSLS